jgi:CheY-like chemotaxis protein
MIDGNPAILLVDDDSAIRLSMTAVLSDAGYSVRSAADGFSALAELQHFQPDLVLSDLNMPGMGGSELLGIVRGKFPWMRSVAMSGSFLGSEVPDGIYADAFYPKGMHGTSRLLEIIAGLTCPVSANTPGGETG